MLTLSCCLSKFTMSTKFSKLPSIPPRLAPFQLTYFHHAAISQDFKKTMLFLKQQFHDFSSNQPRRPETRTWLHPKSRFLVVSFTSWLMPGHPPDPLFMSYWSPVDQLSVGPCKSDNRSPHSCMTTVVLSFPEKLFRLPQFPSGHLQSFKLTAWL